jgi:hypothetical protein
VYVILSRRTKMKITLKTLRGMKATKASAARAGVILIPETVHKQHLRRHGKQIPLAERKAKLERDFSLVTKASGLKAAALLKALDRKAPKLAN